MNTSGDAAEQVVRMSLEGAEAAVKISGQGAKILAIQLAATLKEEKKTKGKARLSSMLKSGSPLKVYEVRQKDLATFAREAKRYGVLYCVLKDKENKDENAMVDVIARVEDASKIQRITDRFQLVASDTANVISDVQKTKTEAAKAEQEQTRSERERGERIMKSVRKEEPAVNPMVAKTENGRPSEPDSKQTNRSSMSGRDRSKLSVREKLEVYRKEQEKGRAERAKEPRTREGDLPGRAAPKTPKTPKKEKGR